MSDNEAIRYRLEALGWQRKYKQLQVETAERLEKLEPGMVPFLYGLAAVNRAERLGNTAVYVDQIAAAIQHAIGEDDDNCDL